MARRTPSPPRLRNVLVIVDLEGVRSHMIKVHDDIMESTTLRRAPRSQPH